MTTDYNNNTVHVFLYVPDYSAYICTAVHLTLMHMCAHTFLLLYTILCFEHVVTHL